ncbi:MAG TPA: hypothetical protein VKA36_07865 [Solirubrobacterales bacterium]|nr:hypothetical protein [Solirubrobacterales bacterium]
MERSSETESLERARADAVPEELRTALVGERAYLVGGTIRDALLGRQLSDDVDLAVEGELDPILDRLGLPAHTHERFGTASVQMDGLGIDIARTRRERYPQPGALPEVEPAPIRADLGRRDFTVNALAIPVAGDLELLDPYDGMADLRAGLLRSIASGSFRDDPTRALRAARYAARLGFDLEGETESELRASDLSTVSADRVEADLRRIASEPSAVLGFDLLAAWGLLALDPERGDLLSEAAELSLLAPWGSLIDRGGLLVEIAIGPWDRIEAALRLARETRRERPASELFELARSHDDHILAIARAAGAERLDQHVSEWRRVELTIGGSDLIAAGVPAGPERGEALRAALHARIDGEIPAGREAELEVALAATGRSS